MSIERLQAPPSLRGIYASAIRGARARRGDRLPERDLRLTATADPDRLAAYDDVCGFPLSDRLPPTYPHVLAFPLAMSLMAGNDFPFPLAGLVHVANRIRQQRPVRLGEQLDLSVRVEELRDHPRGRQFDAVAEAAVKGEQVWTSASTYLRIEKAHSPGRGAKAERPERPAATAIWRVPAGTGRRYAAVSGDYNPIHLHPLSARLFGFPTAIAHGMWLKARCLAALEGRLPDAFSAQVEFKSPVLLPARVAFAASQAKAGAWTLEAWDDRTGKPHLSGKVDPL